MPRTSAARSSPETFEQVNALFPILVEKSKQQASSLSGGQQQMLAVGRGHR